jgi:murein DD-endopeptidase
VIAAVGFTGSAGGPQLHFHVADANSSLGAEGLPFEIDGFDLLGTLDSGTGLTGCADASSVLAALGSGPWTLFDGTLDPRRTRELPAPNVVVDFGKDGAR